MTDTSHNTSPRPYAPPSLESLGRLVDRTAGPVQQDVENLDALYGGEGGFQQTVVDPS